jgi:hypothetical protein
MSHNLMIFTHEELEYHIFAEGTVGYESQLDDFYA